MKKNQSAASPEDVAKETAEKATKAVKSAKPKKEQEEKSSPKASVKNNAAEELKKDIQTKLIMHGAANVEHPSAQQLYRAVVAVMKARMTENREAFKRRTNRDGAKKVCYLCMEFLLGRSLRNNAMNMGIYGDLCKALEKFGSSFEEIYACETDPGLGNGGLGRLAACFMDSLTAQDYAANGYSLCYENGLFRQRLVDGEQVELPDVWMPDGGAWLVPRGRRVRAGCRR